MNAAANTVRPSYDFSNAAPRLVNFRTAGLITGVLGILIQPWRLVQDPSIHIFAWLGFYGGLLGTVAGVLIAGYWVRHRTSLQLAALYRREGRYWFSGGWNWAALSRSSAALRLQLDGRSGRRVLVYLALSPPAASYPKEEVR